jgi:peptidoglycan/xylan/chitin deacetylase (PgdA/CDA1 family)
MSPSSSLSAAMAYSGSTLSDMTRPGVVSILIFHRVLARPDELLPSEVDARTFETLMRVVARGFNVLTLGEALRLRAERRLPARALVITFDDGYADNAEVALPILVKLGLKATIFVSTGFLDGGRMWNDTVIECLRRTRQASLDLQEFGLGLVSVNSAQARRDAILALLPRIKYMTLEAREQALARLARLCRPEGLPDQLMMRTGQVVELHRHGMEIGAHTVNHPILRLQDDNEAEREIVQGQRRLQDITQAPVDVFAYPNGRPATDYERRHRDMLARAGMRGAVSTAEGVVTAESDHLQLPRFSPWRRHPLPWTAQLVGARFKRQGHSRPMSV